MSAASPVAGTPHERKTRAISVASLIVAALSFAASIMTLYFSQLRPAELELTLGQYVLTSAGPRIGIIAVITNEGSRQGVLTSAVMQWDKPAAELEYSMITPGIEQIEHWKRDGGATTSATAYTIATPIAVKAHEQTTAILWFIPRDRFALEPGEHEATIVLNSRANVSARTRFRMFVSSGLEKRIEEHPEAEFPISIGAQQVLK